MAGPLAIPTLPPADHTDWRRWRLFAGVSTMAATALAINAAITQYIAATLHYDPALGKPWFNTTYAPWQWMIWRQAPWASSQSPTFDVALSVRPFWSPASGCSSPSRHQRPYAERRAKSKACMATARWIDTADELRSIGFLPRSENDPNDGVYVGAWTDPKTRQMHYLRHSGPEHIGGPSPPRAQGKASAWCCRHCCPTRTAPSSNDMKGELWGTDLRLAGYPRREHRHQVRPCGGRREAPASTRLTRSVLQTLHAVGDAQNLVTMIVDPDGKGLSDHWDQNRPRAPHRSSAACTAQGLGTPAT